MLPLPRSKRRIGRPSGSTPNTDSVIVRAGCAMVGGWPSPFWPALVEGRRSTGQSAAVSSSKRGVRKRRETRGR